MYLDPGFTLIPRRWPSPIHTQAVLAHARPGPQWLSAVVRRTVSFVTGSWFLVLVSTNPYLQPEKTVHFSNAVKGRAHLLSAVR